MTATRETSLFHFLWLLIWLDYWVPYKTCLWRIWCTQDCCHSGRSRFLSIKQLLGRLLVRNMVHTRLLSFRQVRVLSKKVSQKNQAVMQIKSISGHRPIKIPKTDYSNTLGLKYSCGSLMFHCFFMMPRTSLLLFANTIQASVQCKRQTCWPLHLDRRGTKFLLK